MQVGSGDTATPPPPTAARRGANALPPEGVLFALERSRRGGAVPTERKIAQVAELKELIESVNIAIGTAYQGIPVPDQTQLRRSLLAEGATLRVIKNTLLQRAAEESGQPLFAELAQGPTALVTHPDDPVAAARAVQNYQRENPQTPFEVRNAVVDGQLVDAAYIADLATVPSREVLIGRIAGGLTGKIVELMGLLQASTRELAGLIDARAEQLEGTEA
ncbi:MAG: 50S ribosomal protein L10 [Chloroflexi bacterium]|nr:50S ribosomal protein L10 [Chloroflexota bacterium]